MKVLGRNRSPSPLLRRFLIGIFVTLVWFAATSAVWSYERAACDARVEEARASLDEVKSHLEGAEQQLERFKRSRTRLQGDVTELTTALERARAAAAEAERSADGRVAAALRGATAGLAAARRPRAHAGGGGAGAGAPAAGGGAPPGSDDAASAGAGARAGGYDDGGGAIDGSYGGSGSGSGSGSGGGGGGADGAVGGAVVGDAADAADADAAAADAAAAAAAAAAAVGASARKPLQPFPLSPEAVALYRARGAGGAGGAAGRARAAARAGLDVEPAPRAPGAARALLVVAYNRPDYLARCLSSVLAALPAHGRPHVYVSQDGDDAGVAGVVERFAGRFRAEAPDVPFTHLRHGATGPPVGARGEPVPGWAVGYYKLSAHFKWALGELFGGRRRHPRVIVLEDDLEIAPDFFGFFSAVEPLLDADASLLAASAWSDLGQGALVADPRQVHRTDFFGGLGWMLTAHAWEELGPKWPAAFWDDWLREPAQRRGRAFLRPEQSRTYTYGESGVSQAQFFETFLATIALARADVEWDAEDLTYLAPAAWDAELDAAVAGARRAESAEALADAECAPAPWAVTSGVDAAGALVPLDVGAGAGAGGARGGAGDAPAATDVAFFYAAGPPTDEWAGYRAAARVFGFIDDVKAGVPRTAYRGVTVVKHRGCRKLLVAPEYRAGGAGGA